MKGLSGKWKVIKTKAGESTVKLPIQPTWDDLLEWHRRPEKKSTRRCGCNAGETATQTNLGDRIDCAECGRFVEFRSGK